MTYGLLKAATSDFIKYNIERNTIISKVNITAFQDLHHKSDNDNSYQNLKKIMGYL